jgi:hypothetical protein
MIGCNILCIFYGIHPRSKDDPFLELAERTISEIAATLTPGRILMVSTYSFLDASLGLADNTLN